MGGAHTGTIIRGAINEKNGNFHEYPEHCRKMRHLFYRYSLINIETVWCFFQPLWVRGTELRQVFV
jgi:hypothetical protein